MVIRSLVKWILVVLVMGSLLIGTSFAADKDDQAVTSNDVAVKSGDQAVKSYDQVAKPEEKTEKAGNPWFSITPRAWYTSMNVNNYSSSVITQSTNKELQILLYGATIAISPTFLPQTDFLLTVLHGTGETTGSFVWFNVVGTAGDYKVDATRTDIELLSRYRIRDTAVNIFYGLRYIRLDNEETFTTQGPIWSETGTNKRKIEREYWIPEIGTGFTADVTGNGRHRLFGNATLGYGFGKRTFIDTKASYTGDATATGSGISIDANVGYELNIIKYLTFHLRYRGTFFQGNDADSKSYDVIHGPEIGLKVSF